MKPSVKIKCDIKVLKFLMVMFAAAMIVYPSSVVAEIYSDNFDTGFSSSLSWRMLGTDYGYGTISLQDGSGVGGSKAVRVQDTHPTGDPYEMPVLSALDMKYFDITPDADPLADISAKIKFAGPSTIHGPVMGGIGFGVIGPAESVYGTVGAMFYFNVYLSKWQFILYDADQEDIDLLHNMKILASQDLPVSANPRNFQSIHLKIASDGSLIGNFTADDATSINLSATRRLPIDIAAIGLFANGVPYEANFIFDDFSMSALSDERPYAFTDVERVNDTLEHEWFPSWSHDSQYITYVKRELETSIWNIYVEPISGAGPVKKCTEAIHNVWNFGNPIFSPNNEWVIFNVECPQFHGDVNRADAKSDSIIVHDLFSSERFPDSEWVACEVTDIDGTNYLFGQRKQEADSGVGYKRNLFCVAINEDGSLKTDKKPIMLTAFPSCSAVSNWDPTEACYNKETDRLLLTSVKRAFPEGDEDLPEDRIYILDDITAIIGDEVSPPTDYTDSRFTAVVTGSNWHASPRWSRDGRYIYYSEDAFDKFDFDYADVYPGGSWASIMGNSHFEIFGLDVTATPYKPIKINQYRPFNQGLLGASPDGTWLVFVSDDPDDGDSRRDGDIYKVPLGTKTFIEPETGGTIQDASGTNLEIPAGSLDDSVDITMKSVFPADIPDPEGLEALGLDQQNLALAREIVIDPPLDTIFTDPKPTLELHYTHEEILGLTEPDLKVYVYTASSGWEVLYPINRDFINNTLTVELSHFSTFVLAGPLDGDGDGVADENDNCPGAPNPDQLDSDRDGVGDLCDNCPETANPDQIDSNGNGIGDACENTAPIANAGTDQTLSAGIDCMANATLDGSGSSDPDNDPLVYMWSWDGGSANGSNPTIRLPLGTTEVTLIVNDGFIDSEPDTVLITVIDDLPPELNIPADIVVECTSDGQDVNLGTASATDNCCGEVTIANNAPDLFTLGETVVTWTAVDCNGNSASGSQTVTISDTTPPEINVSVSPEVLWPPNHKMVEVVPSIQTNDVCCGTNVSVELLGIEVNEGDLTDTYDPNYDSDQDAGYIGNDIQVNNGTIYLRAERSGNSDGRIYTISYEATDCAGNTATAACYVTVPHNQ